MLEALRISCPSGEQGKQLRASLASFDDGVPGAAALELSTRPYRNLGSHSKSLIELVPVKGGVNTFTGRHAEVLTL